MLEKENPARVDCNPSLSALGPNTSIFLNQRAGGLNSTAGRIRRIGHPRDFTERHTTSDEHERASGAGKQIQSR
jgi:hypothetical protein